MVQRCSIFYSIHHHRDFILRMCRIILRARSRKQLVLKNRTRRASKAEGDLFQKQKEAPVRKGPGGESLCHNKKAQGHSSSTDGRTEIVNELDRQFAPQCHLNIFFRSYRVFWVGVNMDGDELKAGVSWYVSGRNFLMSLTQVCCDRCDAAMLSVNDEKVRSLRGRFRLPSTSCFF